MNQGSKDMTEAAETPVEVTFDGTSIKATQGMSLLQVWTAAGLALTENVGCMGQGVCGACRVLLRRPGERLAATALACETLAEDGMQVSFLDHFPASRAHSYDLHNLTDSWSAIEQIDAVFPEAKSCRHCSGCDRACPKGIEVQRMVNLAAEGQVDAAAALFDHCVMCNLCVAACPEHISPAHLGQFVRRMNASFTLRPADLVTRLHEINTGHQAIDFDTAGANPPAPAPATTTGANS